MEATLRPPMMRLGKKWQCCFAATEICEHTAPHIRALKSKYILQTVPCRALWARHAAPTENHSRGNASGYPTVLGPFHSENEKPGFGPGDSNVMKREHLRSE